jgi:hypothetical protein
VERRTGCTQQVARRSCNCYVIHDSNIIKKNMETFIEASKEVGLEINVEETKYMLLSRHQNVGQKRVTKCFFLLERPNLFAICNNTFSKWWEE